jgi:hypothetical protein
MELRGILRIPAKAGNLRMTWGMVSVNPLLFIPPIGTDPSLSFILVKVEILRDD